MLDDFIKTMLMLIGVFILWDIRKQILRTQEYINRIWDILPKSVKDLNPD